MPRAMNKKMSGAILTKNDPDDGFMCSYCTLLKRTAG